MGRRQKGFDAMHENRVIELMREWLSRNGYENIRTVLGNRPGHDIDATGPNGASIR